MADVLTTEQRHLNMSRIRSTDTKPELVVRRLIHALGYRYRLHARDLPGRPDLVFPGRRAVIFVHGCFWHRHTCRNGISMPSTRPEFWRAKFESNVLRDLTVRRRLQRTGWRVMVIWECQTRPTSQKLMLGRVIRFLNS